MKRLISFVIAFLSLVVPAMAQDAVLPLELSGNKLIVAPGTTTPAVTAGQTLRIEIPNVVIPSGATWTFRMAGGTVMAQSMNGSTNVFSAPVPASFGSALAVTFSDSTGTVSGGPFQFFAATNAGSSTSNAAAGAAPLTEPNFRKTYDQVNDFVNLYFNAAGMLVHGDIPRDIDDNDVFRFYVYGTAAEAQSITVEVDGTLTEADQVAVLGSASLGQLKNIGQLQGTGLSPDENAIYRLGSFGPFAAPSITVKVSKTDSSGTKLLRQYPIRINQTYIAAYRLLGARSDIRFNNFTTGPVSGQTGNFIQNTAATGPQMRYFLTVVPYAWGLRGSSWRGRDIAKLPIWYQRINPMIGLGLKNAGKEYVAGVSIEVARGFDVVWGWHRATVNTLSGGYKEGDAFSGDAGMIPTVEKTQHDTVFGVSLDLRVATQMLSSLFK